MIDIIDEGEWTRPAMAPGALDRHYFEAAAKGKLMVQQCPACDHRQFPPKGICNGCGGEPEWLEASGEGVVNTFTIVRRHGVEPFKSLAPFALAMIDLPEGVRLMGNLTGIDPDDLRVGLAVRAYALKIDDEMALPLWRLAAG